MVNGVFHPRSSASDSGSRLRDRSSLGLGTGVAGALALGVCGPASAATVDLDTHSTAPGSYAGPVVLPAIAAGDRQIAQVQGTMSLWARNSWSSPRAAVCGPATVSPIFPSPGVANGPAGVDADRRFGPLIFKDKTTCDGKVSRARNFELTTGGTFAKGTPLPSSDPATHTYQYALVGTGAPAQFRFYDPTSYDNYGILRITTRAATGSDCVGIGAAQLGFGSVATCQTALGDTPAVITPPAEVPPPAVVPAPPAGPVSGAGASTPSKSTGTDAASGRRIVVCRSKRAFFIRLKEPRSRKLRSAKVYLSGKRIATAYRRKGDRRLVARIVLKNRPRGTFTIRIKAVRTNGKRINGFRRYKTCAGAAASSAGLINKSKL
jgi:hypothetical protein